MLISPGKKPFTYAARYFIIAMFMVMFFACTRFNTDVKHKQEISVDPIPPPQITILADLPDSNKAAQIFIGTVPLPQHVNVPRRNTGSRGNMAKFSPPLAHYLEDQITHLPIPAEAQGRGLFTTYTSDNGIALDEIYCSFKDRSGILWFGTNGGGISRYDGKTFTNYTTANGLAYNLIWCITQDRNDNLWIGTDGGGVSKYDGRGFTNFTTTQGLAQNVVYSIKEDKSGNLWFGTNGGGISKYDGKSFSNYDTSNGLASNYINVIDEDNNGNLWIGTRGAGISKFDGKNFTNFSTLNGLAGNTVRTILNDSTGNLWFGTLGGGVSKFDGERFTNFSMTEGLTDNMVWTIAEDNKGNLWFGTDQGASKYDGKSFVNFTLEQGIANNKITCITEDEKGNMWFGTFGGGLSKFSGSAISNFTITQGLPNNVVYSIVEDSSGALWFATNGGGVSKYDGKSFLNYTTEQGLAHNVVYSILKDSKSNLWFGTYRHGISKFDGNTFTNYTSAQGLPNNTVFRIIEDKKGNLWFATSGGGVSKFDGESFTNYTTKQGLANNVVFSMMEDKSGNLWFGTLGGGVSKFDGKSFTNYTTAQGLADNGIWVITEDSSGDLWFGTQKGLNLLRLKNQVLFSESISKKLDYNKPVFELFTTKDGLPHDFISQVVEVNKNTLYIGTNLGISELTTAHSQQGEEKKWISGNTYNTKTGFPIKDVNSGPGAMFIDSKGIIWIGTGSDKTGLVRLDPKTANSTYHHPPKVLIRNIKINNENISWSDLAGRGGQKNMDSITSSQINSEELTNFGRLLTEEERDSMATDFKDIRFRNISKWWPVPEDLVLPHDHNNISFDFNAVETGRNLLVNYQYKLEGYDKQWNHPTDVASASYGNIFEGRYRFLVKARNPEGIWSEPIVYNFEVLPPWWRTWWAYAAYLLLFLWALKIFSRYRERRLRLEKENLELQVHHRTQMLEDTIITLKNTQSQLIQSEKMASLGELTAGIAHEIQNPLNFVNNFSEINKDLLDDMHLEIEKGNIPEIKDIARDILQNTEKITQHGKRADSIVKSMLQHTRTSTGHREPTDINKLANEFLKLSHHVIMGKEKNFQPRTETSFDPDIENIYIIPQEIGRVLLNLLNNAFWAVSEKFKTAGQGYTPMVSVSTKKLADKIEIKIKDNGMGIPDKTKDKIFQPFFTTKPAGQGTGLGLSLSYDIVKAHNGSLLVDSKEGEFTEFTVLIPI